MGFVCIISRKAGEVERPRGDRATSPLVSKDQEQPVKSNSAAVVLAPAVTFSAIALESLLVVREEGEHIGAPDVELVASASTAYKTSPVAGNVIVVLPAANVPTVGLLAGTTNV
jgi:hypothetical protein